MPNETTPEQIEFIEVTVPDGKEVVVITVPENVEVQVVTKEEPKPEKTPVDNYLTIGLVSLIGLLAVIAVICKAVKNRKPAPAPVVEEAPAPAEAPVAPGAAGQLKLHDVEPKTAAMLMAIVADKMQKPVNELRFISIKEVK